MSQETLTYQLTTELLSQMRPLLMARKANEIYLITTICTVFIL
jgi:hypothetical protein